MNQPRPTGNYGYERGLWRASVRVMSTTVVQALPITREPVLVMTCDPAEAAWLRETLEPRFTLGVCGSASAGLAALRQRPRQPIVLGSRLADTTPVGFLADARAQVMAALGEDALVLTVGDQGPAGATLEADAVFYAITRGLHGHDVRALVDCAVAELRARACPPPHAMRGASEAAQLQQVLGLARRLALQDDATQAASVAEEAVLELTDALRARCLFYDAESSELWRAAGDGQEGGRATAGLAGFAARTVRTVVVPRADQDPRYAPAIDDPQGAGDERLLVVPVTDPRGQVHAVLVAVRRERQPEFDAADVELLQALVEQWGPLLGQLTLRQQAEAVLAEARAEHEQRVVFRADAMRLHDEGQRTGEVLRGSPGWASVSYWLVLAFVVVGIAYLALGRVHQHSVGPAVIHTEGQHELTAVVAGKVVGLEVEPGQAVAAGQVLARLYDAAEEAELEQLDVEWRARLRQFLASPGRSRRSRAARGPAGAAGSRARAPRGTHDSRPGGRTDR